MESFKAVFLTVVVAVALVVVAVLFHMKRPSSEEGAADRRPGPGHGQVRVLPREETGAIVAEYRGSAHAARGTNCLDCHQPVEGQDELDHRGFVIAETVTAPRTAPVPRGAVPGVPPEPARRARLRRRAGARPSRRSRSSWPSATIPGASSGRPTPSRPGGGDGHPVRLRDVPLDRPPQPGRLHRDLHGVPRAPRHLGGAGPPAPHLRPVPHGAGPLSDRDLRGIQARRPVRGAAGRDGPRRSTPTSSPWRTCRSRPAPPAT